MPIVDLYVFLLGVCTEWMVVWYSGVAKAGPGRARAKFVRYMCVRVLVLLAQWLSVQQVPGQYQSEA